MRRALTAAIALATLAAIVAMAAAAIAQTDPPGPGMDWVIDGDSTLVTGTDIHLDGNLTVIGNSQLVLRDLTLTMDPWEDHGTEILIEQGSTLRMTNVRIRSADPDAHYWFVIQGVANISGCDVRDVASTSSARDAWDTVVGGVQIYDSNTTLVDSDFHDCERINVYVNGADPNITRCDFYNAEYMYTGTEYDYVYIQGFWSGSYYILYMDATGLFLNEANPVIERCTFTNNGVPSSALGYYYSSSSTCFVQTWGRGILAFDSSPYVGNCTLNDNGNQPLDTVYGGTRVVFQDGTYPYFYNFPDNTFPVEGGLACVGAAAPVVNWSTFDNNNLFGIVGYGGAPAVINHTTVSATHNLRQSGTSGLVLSPSAGIYLWSSGGGACLIENSSASANLVVQNVYVEGPTATFVRYTNSDNVVQNAYNLCLGAGTHYVANSTLEGRPASGGEALLTNIYLGSNRGGAVRVTVRDSTLRGAQTVLYSTSGGHMTAINSTLTAVSDYSFFLYGTNVDCVDCPSVYPERISGYSWSGASKVRIMYHADFLVTWQNGEPVRDAFIQVKNATQDFLYGGITDVNGTIPQVLLTSKTLLLTTSSSITITNAPIYAQAFASGLQSVQYRFDFISKPTLAYAIRIYDTRDPEIHIFSPAEGSGQNSTNLSIYGMCLDIGSGVALVEVQADSGAWLVANGTDTWSAYLDLGEGKHQLVVRATDVAGNDVLKVLKSVTIDLTPPYLEILDPVKDVWYANSMNYTLRGVVREQHRLTVNGMPVTVTPDGSWTFVWGLNSGNNEFLIRAVDWVGNSNEVVKSVVRDSTIPKLILTSPVDGSYTNISQVEVKGITEVGATIYVNGDPMPTFSGRFAATLFLTEGPNAVTVDAIDRAGNLMRVVRTVVLDTVPPLLRIESPLGSGIVNDQTLQIRGYLDDMTIESVVVNGLLVPVEEGRFSKAFRLEEGLNIVTIEVWDQAQNYASRTFRITLDTAPPMLQVIEPAADMSTREGVLQLRGRVEQGVAFTIVGVPNAVDMDLLTRIEDTFRWTDYPLRAGLNTLTFEAVDAVGNVARIVRVVHYDLVPPELLLGALPDSTYNEVIEVTGVMLNGTGVSVNNIPVVLGPDGTFVQSVHLLRGRNSISVKAIDEVGNEAQVVVDVTRDDLPSPPKGILGAGAGPSIAMIVVMLVIGLAVIYPAMRAGRKPEGAGAAPAPKPRKERPSRSFAPSGAPALAKPAQRVKRHGPPPPPPPPPPPGPSDPGQTPPWR